MRTTYDVIVLGAGPAGGQVASGCAEAGLSVALTESRGFGGVCPLRGCNPKKVLFSAPEAVAMSNHLKGKGVASQPVVDWAELTAFRDTFLDGLPQRIKASYDKAGCTTFEGKTRLLGQGKVMVETTDGPVELTGKHVVVAVGCVPRPLDVPGGELAATSDDFLKLTELPRRILFIGGGFISMELAHISLFSGCEVRIVNRSERILRGFDPDMCDVLLQATRDAGGDVRLNLPLHSIEGRGNALVARFGQEGETAFEADMVLNATGRIPEIHDIGLDTAGVEHGRHGILVDEYMRSVSAPNVWAAGDVASTPYALTPTATIEANAVADGIIHGTPATPDYTAIPSVTFTIPPIASAGLDEETARKQNIPYTLKQGDLAKWFSWERLGEQHGGYKILLDEENDRILGAHLVGHNSEELINLLAAAIRNKVSLRGLRNTVWAYPTCGYYLKYIL